MKPFNPSGITPANLPPLEHTFLPASLYNRNYEESLGSDYLPLVIGLERNEGEISRVELRVHPEGSINEKYNYKYVERIIKFLLWQRGGWKLYIGGSDRLAGQISLTYSISGNRSFDAQFMGNKVYEQLFTVVPCRIDEVPQENEQGKALGRHLDGYRIGFDLGASDRKVSAVINGEVVYSEEVNWEPRNHSDPGYHYAEILTAIRTAASKMPRIDAIGGSSAGIYIHNHPRVASLFRAVPDDQYHLISNLFQEMSKELGVPIEVINDGDVTALAGAMSINDNAVLGIALGSSLAGGYVDRNGAIRGWLNELAFAPIDYSDTAPQDEWSGDSGCGASYLSQQCVFRLCKKVGIEIPAEMMDAEKLAFVQHKLESGHEGALQIWQTMGTCLGYALAHYAHFYDFKHILILGRCTSGQGGNILLEKAKKVLEIEFKDLVGRINIQLPDEKNRRVGQSVAAASLPALH